MSFTEWFNTKLVIGRFPLPAEINKSNFKYIINVSDEYISYCHDAAITAGIKYFWFPMSECTLPDMGLNSIYGALQILHQAEQENAKVLLHCHAGANRSPTVADAYYFLRTKKHREPRKISQDIIDGVNKMCGITEPQEQSGLNFIQENIKQTLLPCSEKMEAFLAECEKIFEKEITYRGGGLDMCKEKSGIGSFKSETS